MMALNNEIRCAVVDDEPLAAQLIASYVEKTPELNLAGVFGSAQEAVKAIVSGTVDLVFLDINMPQLNGLEFAKIMPRNCRVVFVTAYDNYAIDAFKSNALDYLLKPVSYAEFLGAVQKAMEWHSLSREARRVSKMKDQIVVKSDHKYHQIDVEDILYVEGLKEYVRIFTDDNPQGIVTLLSMKLLEVALPEKQFLRVHRSYIVNMGKVKQFDRTQLTVGERILPIGDGYRGALNDYIDSRLIRE